MAKPHDPDPVQLFIAVLAPSADTLPEVTSQLIARFGPIDYTSPPFPFDFTDYYESEMGEDLKRWFLSFERLISPGDLASVKIATHQIEDTSREGKRRRVNLDPGYMDIYKIVLASAKFQGPKIYIGSGIYADPTLYYDKGWKSFPWGFPDFIDGRYDDVLSEIRRLYKAKRRTARE